jgi:hypothetical protein
MMPTEPRTKAGQRPAPQVAAAATAVVLALLVIPILAQAPAEPPVGPSWKRPAAGSPTRTEEGSKRLREGTRIIDIEGRFEFTGDRIAFFRADADESYKVLENLSLERVSKVLSESREKPQWTVTGSVTEFNNANYLLVTKAVLKPQQTPTGKPGSNGKRIPPGAGESEVSARPVTSGK